MSLAAWFQEASQGRFTLSGSVRDWRTAEALWADQEPKRPGVGIDLARALFADVLDVAGHDGTGNGRIDHLFVVHSGRLTQDRIGPRALFHPGQADRSVLLQSQGIGSTGQRLPFGFYLHEAAHRWFREGDQYGDHRHGSYGIGTWGLMGLGQWGPHAGIATDALFRFPVHPRAAVKARLGWVEVQEVRASQDLQLTPVEAGGVVASIPGPERDLWLEVRSPRGFHADLPGHGLLVWDEPKRRRGTARLVQADGLDELARGTDLGRRPVPPIDEDFADAGDPFPGSAGATSWTTPDGGVQLRDIALGGDRVTLGVAMSRATPPPPP